MRTVSSSKFPMHQVGSQSSRHVDFVACQLRVPGPCDDREIVRIPTVACQQVKCTPVHQGKKDDQNRKEIHGNPF